MKMTYELAHAAARDAGDGSMRAAGRSKWNEDDWNAMCAQFERLYSVDDQLAQQAWEQTHGRKMGPFDCV